MNKKSNHNNIKSIWKSGKIQRTSRITYDIIWNIILFFLVIGFIGIFFAGGLGAGYFASLVKDEPIRPASSMEKDIYNYEETSKFYFDDNILLGDVRSDLHREETSLDKISDLIINAVIATEDESFYEHQGVVPKAITRAILQEALNSDVKTGGSTLTQQLIKNQILTNEVSFDRKAKEILLALRLENFFEKNQILEAYLNIIPYGREASGRNIAGVQTAAKGIFGVNANEVNLPQAAYLAGLPQSPSAYTPYVNGGGLKSEDGLQPGLNRMKTVLRRMYDAEFIKQQQYEEALEYDIVADFIEGTKSPNERYPYLTYDLEREARIILKKKLLEDDGYTEEDIKNDEQLSQQYDILAERSLRMDGYNIYSTINKKIYDVMQKTAKDYSHYGPDRTAINAQTGKIIIDENTGEPIIEQVETSAILIENSTGKIISFVGGRDFTRNENNHATSTSRQVGSTIKGVFDYPAAIEKGAVQPGTPIADIPSTYSSGEPYKNYGGRNYGIVPARKALASSYNIPAVKTYMKIVQENPVKEFLEPMGFNRLTPDDYSNESLALGTVEASMQENTGAFSTLGNNGQYNEPYMIDKITTNNGEIIYEHESIPVDIYSPQTTYLTIDMMRDVLRSGTATYLNSQLKHGSVDWAGKTGTTDDYRDAWFIATNPNVTFGTWIGYDSNMGLDYCPGCSLTYSQRNTKLWAELINAVAEVNPELITPSERFQRPEGIVQRSYCAISGMLPSELCKKAGLVYSDLFNAKHVPTEVDDSLISGSYTTIDGKSVIAGPNTPAEFVNGDGLTFNPEFLKRNGYDKLSNISQLYPLRDRHLWEKISAPSGELGEDIADDGTAPSAPQGLNASGNQLTWTKSSSKDVVGYRIYFAAEPEGNFRLIGNTDDTNANFTGDRAVFHIRAVDYFGLESAPSNEIIVGTFEAPEENEEVEEPENDNEDTNENVTNNVENE